MKKYINRNYFWANLFVTQLYKLGVRHVCISPGSRNTPLTLAFAENKSLKKYVHIDERSAGFFALGLAKSEKKPVVVVTSSGTAVAELYPAIIEAFIQRVPLIICTADRPSYLRDTGANQTINQDNIFSNHIRKFIDFGLPSINENKLKNFAKKILGGYEICISINCGPVHFNFPFKKPLEPDSFTDNISYKLSDFIKDPQIVDQKNKKLTLSKKSIDQIKKSKRPMILLGWGNFNNNFYAELSSFTRKNNIPVLVDGTSEFRFFNGKSNNIITNQSAFINELEEVPDLIIQFGNVPTSQAMLKFIDQTKVKKYLVNEFGDMKDPSKRKGELLKISPIKFLDEISNSVKIGIKDSWSENIIDLDHECEKLKNKMIDYSDFGLESRITNEILDQIPPKSNLFVSNSLPIRDFDLFASKRKKGLKIFTNRGASGIDGIISTASGIASESKVKNFLVIGDLAFYHNIGALATLDDLKIELTIILVNNNGGGIFKMLPIAEKSERFEKYFNTPHNVDFKKVVKAFNGNHYSPKTWKSLKNCFQKSLHNTSFSVIEIKTDSQKSVDFRREYLSKISSLNF